MPDAQHKVVHVPDLGVVAFPSSVPDDQVVASIKEFKKLSAKNKDKKSLAFTPQPSGPVVNSIDQTLQPFSEGTKHQTFGDIVTGAVSGIVSPLLHPIDTMKGMADTIKTVMPAYANSPYGPIPVPNPEAGKAAAGQAEEFGKHPAYTVAQNAAPWLLGAALDLKASPLKEVPDRANTRTFHSNPAGEIRVGKDGIPTVWLSPKAWDSYIGVAHPGEADPRTIHGESVPLGPNFAKFATHPDLSQHPVWGHVQELMRKAQEASKQGTAVMAPKTGLGVQAAVRVVREEKIHSWQRGLSKNLNISNYLSPKAFTDLRGAIPESASKTLTAQGYDPEHHSSYVSEAAAHMISGDLLGAKPVEAVEFLSKYFDEVIKQHGPNALQTLEHARGVAKGVQETISNEHTEPGTTQAALRGVPEGRQGSVAQGNHGATSTAPATASRAPEVAAFSRQQENTPEFKNFFKESKAVDDKGQPLVLYHGTRADFNQFNKPIIYATPDPNYTDPFSGHFEYDGAMVQETGGRVLPLYMSIQKPFDVRALGTRGLTPDQFAKTIGVKDVSMIQGSADPAKTRPFWSWFRRNGLLTRDQLQRMGFDGVIQKEEYGRYAGGIEPEGTQTTSYAAFNPTQVKSSIGNRGTFNPENPDIAFNRQKNKISVTAPNGMKFVFPTAAAAANFRRDAGIQ